MNKKQELDDKMKTVWKQPLALSEESEAKIQAAYEKVRQRCEQQAGKKERPVRSFRARRIAAAALAAVMLMASGLVAAAAMGYFSKDLQQENGRIAYDFEINYELQPVEVQVKPGYLPEGMQEFEKGNYWTEEDWGAGISICPLTMVNINLMSKEMTFDHVEHVEYTVIQNMEAHIITFEEEQKYKRGKDIFLFNPDQGYVIWIWGASQVSVEELEQVAEHLEITVTENQELSYEDPAVEEKKAAEEQAAAQWEDTIAAGVREDAVTPFGEELDCQHAGCTIRVEEMQVFDSLYDVPGYTENAVCNLEELKPWLNEDGTQKTYLRAHYDAQENILEEETAASKFLALKVTVLQYQEGKGEETPLDAELVRMTKGQDGVYHWKEDFYMPVPDQEYSLQIDNRCFYLDQPEHLEGNERNHSFFYRSLEPLESLTYTIVFAVDEDVLTDENTELLLNFNAAGNDAYHPAYYALK